MSHFLASVDTLVEVQTLTRAVKLSGRRFREGTFARAYDRVDLADVRTLYEAVIDQDLYRNFVRKMLDRSGEFKNLDAASREVLIATELAAIRRDPDVYRQVKAIVSSDSEVAFSLDPWIDSQQLHEFLQLTLEELADLPEDSKSEELTALEADLKELVPKFEKHPPFQVPDRIDQDTTGLFVFFKRCRNK